MPIKMKQFNALKGEPTRFGSNDPNSMSNRIMRAIGTVEAFNMAEIAEREECKGINSKQLRTMLSNLANKKNKHGQTKLLIKHDNDHVAFYAINKEYGTVTEAVPSEPVAEETAPANTDQQPEDVEEADAD